MTDKIPEKKKINITPFLLPSAIVLAGLVIGLGLFLGLRSSNKVKGESQNQVDVLPDSVPDQVGAPSTIATTSIDNDPILGNRDTASVAIVEFSDYECPFCKRFRDQTLDEIKTNYIDTGNVILVYRDLPLGFHDPAATREANAAECVREQAGDVAYFQYHDMIFATSPGNGAGIDTDGLVNLAIELGINENSLRECIQSNKYADEIAKDASDAAAIGINGTPGFVIGKLANDGTVEGVVVNGAQPYTIFDAAISEQLK